MLQQDSKKSKVTISANLVEKALRSEELDWTLDEIKYHVDRYEKFFSMVARNPGQPFAPTKCIDQIWHLHMQSPVNYYQDCMASCGTIIDHDGGFGAVEEELPELKETFFRTAALWEKEYGEKYSDNPEAELKNCWHDCQGRCWHACASSSSYWTGTECQSRTTDW